MQTSTQLIIFDFDGTLADTMPVFLRLFDEAADQYGFRRVQDNGLEAMRGLDARQIMALHEVPLWKVPMIAAFMRRRMADVVEQIRLFPGMAEALSELHRRGTVLAIVSSNSRQNVEAVLGPGLTRLFRHVECGTSLFGKRSRLRKVLAAAAVAPQAALLVGDEIRDAEAARGAGIGFAAVAWGYNHADALIAQHPARLFRQVAELLQQG